MVAVTKIKSRYVVAAGGVILVLLGLLPVLGRVVAAVPTAVLGGAGIVLFGTVAASGIRTLAKVEGEVRVGVMGPVTQASVLDALEARYPMLRGAIRDHDSLKRRAFIRFFACSQDLSHEPPDAPLPDEVARGVEPFLVIGAVAGGSPTGAFGPCKRARRSVAAHHRQRCRPRRIAARAGSRGSQRAGSAIQLDAGLGEDG